MPTSCRRNITFELPIEVFEALELDTKAYRAASRHKRARDIVIEYLTNGQVTGPNEAFERLDSEVAYLQELVRKLAYSVIVHAARGKSEDANKWIREHMPSRPA
jgi:hypothetical protein